MWITYVATGVALLLLYWPTRTPLIPGEIELTENYYLTVSFLVALILIVAGWAVADGAPSRRVAAVSLLVVPQVAMVGIWSVALDLGFWIGTVGNVAGDVAAVMGWLLLRGRPRASYWALALTAGGDLIWWFLGTYLIHGSTSRGLLVAIASLAGTVGAAWLAAWIARAVARRPDREARLVAQQQVQQAAVTAYQAEQIRQWQAAYARANPGQPVPAPPLIPAVPQTRAGTNVCAILSLVLAFFSIAAIPLGHVALSQIRRTGESGRGLAIAGLVIGYSFVALYLAAIAWFFVAMKSINSYGY